jgi:fanconi anemia group D2 protein
VGYGENIPKMILGQFRWLDHLVDNKRLTNKLIETLELCYPQVKKDLIAFIPDVVEDSGHQVL